MEKPRQVNSRTDGLGGGGGPGGQGLGGRERVKELRARGRERSVPCCGEGSRHRRREGGMPSPAGDQGDIRNLL